MGRYFYERIRIMDCFKNINLKIKYIIIKMIWLFFLFIIILCVVYAQKFKDPVPVLLGPNNIEVGLLHTISFPHKGIFQVPNLSLGRYEGILPPPEEGDRIVIDKSNITINQNMYLVPTSYISGNNIVELNGDRNTTCIVRNSSWTCNNVLSQPKNLHNFGNPSCQDNPTPTTSDIDFAKYGMKIVGALSGLIEDEVCPICPVVGSAMGIGSQLLDQVATIFGFTDEQAQNPIFSCAFKDEIYNLTYDAALAADQTKIAIALNAFMGNISTAYANFRTLTRNSYPNAYLEINSYLNGDPLYLAPGKRTTISSVLTGIHDQFINCPYNETNENIFKFLGQVSSLVTWPPALPHKVMPSVYTSSIYPYVSSFDKTDSSKPTYVYSPIPCSFTNYSKTNWIQKPYSWKSIPMILGQLSQYNVINQERALWNDQVLTTTGPNAFQYPNPWVSPNLFLNGDGMFIYDFGTASIPPNTTNTLIALSAVTEMWNDMKTIYGSNIGAVNFSQFSNPYTECKPENTTLFGALYYDNNFGGPMPQNNFINPPYANQFSVAYPSFTTNIYSPEQFANPILYQGQCLITGATCTTIASACGGQGTVVSPGFLPIPLIGGNSILASGQVNTPVVLLMDNETGGSITSGMIIDRIKDFNIQQGDVDGKLQNLWMQYGFAYCPTYNGTYERDARSQYLSLSNFSQTRYNDDSYNNDDHIGFWLPYPTVNLVCGFNSSAGINLSDGTNTYYTPPILPSPNLSITSLLSSLHFTTATVSQSKWFNYSNAGSAPVNLGTYFGKANGDVFGNTYEIDNFNGNISVTLNCTVNTTTGSLTSLQTPRTQFYANLVQVPNQSTYSGPVQVGSTEFLCTNVKNTQRIIDSESPDINFTVTIDSTQKTTGYEYFYATDPSILFTQSILCTADPSQCYVCYTNPSTNSNTVIFDLSNCPFIPGTGLYCQTPITDNFAEGPYCLTGALTLTAIIQNLSTASMIVTYNYPDNNRNQPVTNSTSNGLYEQNKDILIIGPNSYWAFDYSCGYVNEPATTQYGLYQTPRQLNTYTPLTNTNYFYTVTDPSSISFYEVNIDNDFVNSYSNFNLFVQVPDNAVIIFIGENVTKTSHFNMTTTGDVQPLMSLFTSNYTVSNFNIGQLTQQALYKTTTDIWTISNVNNNNIFIPPFPFAPYPFHDGSCDASSISTPCSYETYFNKTIGTNSVTLPMIEDLGGIVMPVGGTRVVFSHLRPDSQYVGDYASQTAGVNYMTPYCTSDWCSGKYMRQVGNGFQFTSDNVCQDCMTVLLGTTTSNCLVLTTPPPTISANTDKQLIF